MKLLKVLFIVFILCLIGSSSVFADEVVDPIEPIVETEASSTPEEVLPKETNTQQENSDTESIEAFSNSSSDSRTEVSCWQDKNKSFYFLN